MKNSASFSQARLLLLIAHCSLLIAFGCSSSDSNNVQPAVPYGPVNLSFDLTNQQYRALRSDNGTVVFPSSSPAGAAGVKGVIVVRENASTYRAFERNCPYRPYDACALVSVDRASHLFLRDTCCNSQFDFRGQVTGGPSPRRLVQYSTSLQGSQLTITN